MKKLLLLFIFILLPFASIKAQESVSPTYGVTVERPMARLEINGINYDDVTIKIKASIINDMLGDYVKITVTDKNGKVIYKKRLKNQHLYAYSDGTIQTGKGEALISTYISKDKQLNKFFGILREKGIY